VNKKTKARVSKLEQELNDIIEGKFNYYNMTELDAVVEIAQELLRILKGAK
jgi:hypothetical protein